MLSTAVNPIKEQEFISIMKDHNITPQQFMDNDDGFDVVDEAMLEWGKMYRTRQLNIQILTMKMHNIRLRMRASGETMIDEVK